MILSTEHKCINLNCTVRGQSCHCLLLHQIARKHIMYFFFLLNISIPAETSWKSFFIYSQCQKFGHGTTLATPLPFDLTAILDHLQ